MPASQAATRATSRYRTATVGRPWARPRAAVLPPLVNQPLTRTSNGADDGIRTRDPHLGKVMLYQLSHVRVSGGLRYQSPAEIDNGTSTGTAFVRTSITIAPSAASTTKAPATCRMLSR